MKACSSTLLDLIPQPKTLNARATFRITRPQFAVSTLANTISVSDPSKIDSCNHGSGILRVTAMNNEIYTQDVQDVTGAWPAWVATGIAVYPGSRPAVDDGYIWYQAANGYVCYRSFSDMGTEVVVRTIYDNTVLYLAPVSNLRCYWVVIAASIPRLWYVNADGTTNRYYGYFFTVTKPRIDVVNWNGSDYLYLTDRDAGRIVEIIVRTNNAANLQFGKARPIVAVDAIDDVYGLNLHGASVINGKVVVTGRLTRTSDGDPVAMDIYMFGPDTFTMSRESFISSSHLGGKMLLVDEQLIVPGQDKYAAAIATHPFGVDTGAVRLVTSDIGNLKLVDAENRSSTATLALSTSLVHPAITKGSEVVIEIAYDNEWMTVLTGEIAAIMRYTGEGQELTIEIVNKTAKRLSQWAPEQGIYIPSQASNIANANDLTQLVWADGDFVQFVSDVGTIDDSDFRWTYAGPGWGVSSLHYNFSADPTVSASCTFYGTGCTFIIYKAADRAIYDLWIDDVLMVTIDCYASPAYYDNWVSPLLTAGRHVFKLTRNAASNASRSIVVSGLVVSDASAPPTYLKPKRLNKLSVLYTAARAAPGGIMRARFYNEPVEDTDFRNPRFGVGANYNRETRVDASTRLGIEYNDVDDSMCGHNGVVALYSRLEYNDNPAIVLYSWVDSQMTRITQWEVTLPTGLVWMQIRYVDGYVQVGWRADGSTTWTTYSYLFNVHPLPFDHETGGHGCIVMERHSVVASSIYVLSGSDTTMGVVGVGQFPASGTVVVEDELMSYSARSNFQLTYTDFGVRYSGTMQPAAAFTTGERIVVHDNEPQMMTGFFTTDNDSRLLGMAVLPFTQGDQPIFDRTFRLVGYDWAVPNMWMPKAAYTSAGWPVYKDNTTYGNYVSFQGTNKEKGLYLSPSGVGIPVSDMEINTTPYDHKVRLLPALHISQRGLNNTIITSHGTTDVIYYVDIELWVDKVEYVTQDEDITLADALKRIIHLTGGSFQDSTLSGLNRPIISTNAWDTTSFFTMPNFITDIEIPAGLPATSSIGLIAQSTSPITNSPASGYYIYVKGNTVGLYSLETQLDMEIIPQDFQADRTGMLRISVQDQRVSLWLDHRPLHTFVLPLPGDESGYYAGFAVRNESPLDPYEATAQYRVSEQYDLMADITVGVRGKGMSIISEMLNNRRVYFRCQPDGGLYFYKTPSDVGNLPDIVISDNCTDIDNEISRVRVEGIKIAEVIDFEAMARIGNVFDTINSMYADTIPDLVSDGLYNIRNIRQRSKTHQMQTVFHPALQPGDAGVIEIDGEQVGIGIMATTVMLGSNGNNFDINAQIEAYTP